MFTRREFFAVSSTAALAAAFSDLLAAQQQPAAAPPPAFEAIRGNVGYFTARGGTIGWLINKDAVIVVDTQYPNTAPLCVEGVKTRASGRGIDVTFNTHHHPDHTGGNAVFQPVSKRLIAHARVPELMKQFASTQANASAPTLPTVTFEKNWSERMGDETVSARHYGPGHTGGDAMIYFERANVAHMGDLFWHEVHPRVDRPGGADIRNWIRTLDTVTNELPADTIFIAGHARPGQSVVAKRDALIGLRNYFEAALAHVRKGIAAQKPQADIVSLPSLPGFEQYQSLTQALTLSAMLTAAYEELMR